MMSAFLAFNRLFLIIISFSDCYEYFPTSETESSKFRNQPFVSSFETISQPQFIHESTNTNVSVKKGTDAFLHCKVAGMGEQSVSWYKRKKDHIQLLTFGFQTYHNDGRFSLAFDQPYDWRLRIKSVKHKDAGTYECQVPTHPPIIRTVNLSVVVPSMKLLDDRGVALREKFYKTGSTIILKCEVDNVPTKKAIHLQWYHGRRRLNYDDPRGGVSVKTEIRGLSAKSWLRIGDAKPMDSGTYICNVSGLKPLEGIVHVIKEESPAPIQTASTAVSAKLLPYATVIISSLYPLVMELLPRR